MTHGTTAATATTAQSVNEPRHPMLSASGTATSGGMKVATAMVVV